MKISVALLLFAGAVSGAPPHHRIRQLVREKDLRELSSVNQQCIDETMALYRGNAALEQAYQDVSDAYNAAANSCSDTACVIDGDSFSSTPALESACEAAGESSTSSTLILADLGLEKVLVGPTGMLVTAWLLPVM